MTALHTALDGWVAADKVVQVFADSWHDKRTDAPRYAVKVRCGTQYAHIVDFFETLDAAEQYAETLANELWGT